MLLFKKVAEKESAVMSTKEDTAGHGTIYLTDAESYQLKQGQNLHRKQMAGFFCGIAEATNKGFDGRTRHMRIAKWHFVRMREEEK